MILVFKSEGLKINDEIGEKLGDAPWRIQITLIGYTLNIPYNFAESRAKVTVQNSIVYCIQGEKFAP